MMIKFMRGGLIMFVFFLGAATAIMAKESDKPSGWAQAEAEKWKGQLGYTVQLINQMPEDKIDYSPGEEVRSFSELFKHIAGSSIFLRAVFEGGDIYGAFDEMQTLLTTPMTKAQLVERMESNMEELTSLISALSDNDLKKTFEFSFLPGKPVVTIKDIITAMGVHFAHHRGQATTYLRLNGITPVGYQNWW